MPSLPAFLLDKYVTTHVKLMVDQNAGRVMRVLTLYVSVSCVAVEAGKSLASLLMKRVKYFGHPARYLMNAVVPTGFYGPLIGAWFGVQHLLRQANKAGSGAKQLRGPSDTTAGKPLQQQQPSESAATASGTEAAAAEAAAAAGSQRSGKKSGSVSIDARMASALASSMSASPQWEAASTGHSFSAFLISKAPPGQ
mmetsp:Transcript_30238/g.67073  ORF Transcript_30238/g.67073 Transcript_30238/m.67073 type:complete len:196 (+) Transcript_30238:217-804(+)